MFLMVDKIGFGMWLQKERENRGWTQSDLARKSGKDRAVINKIENGGALPAVETFLSLSEALNYSPMLLLRKAGLLPPGPDDEVKFDDWKYLLAQMSPEDEAEMRQIAVSVETLPHYYRHGDPKAVNADLHQILEAVHVQPDKTLRLELK